jgi:hypothetical protein
MTLGQGAAIEAGSYDPANEAPWVRQAAAGNPAAIEAGSYDPANLSLITRTVPFTGSAAIEAGSYDPANPSRFWCPLTWADTPLCETSAPKLRVLPLAKHVKQQIPR